MKNLSEPRIKKYCGKNPKLDEIENILQRHANKYKKSFEYFEIICEWNLQLFDTIRSVTSKKM